MKKYYIRHVCFYFSIFFINLSNADDTLDSQTQTTLSTTVQEVYREDFSNDDGLGWDGSPDLQGDASVTATGAANGGFTMSITNAHLDDTGDFVDVNGGVMRVRDVNGVNPATADSLATFDGDVGVFDPLPDIGSDIDTLCEDGQRFERWWETVTTVTYSFDYTATANYETLLSGEDGINVLDDFLTQFTYGGNVETRDILEENRNGQSGSFTLAGGTVTNTFVLSTINDLGITTFDMDIFISTTAHNEEINLDNIIITVTKEVIQHEQIWNCCVPEPKSSIMILLFAIFSVMKRRKVLSF